MRDADNIRAVAELGVDMMGFIFYPQSSRYVEMISSRAGIIPDYSRQRLNELSGKDQPAEPQLPKRVGVFVDDMPQNIVTRIYNYDLDYVQLHGQESPVMIDNLRRTLVPDIAPEIKIIKTISVSSAEDLVKTKDYEGHVDLFLFDTKCRQHGGSGEQFDWSVLDAYQGPTPYLLSGGIGPEDAERAKVFVREHEQCIGIDVNSRFETAPAMKDVAKLKTFIETLRQ